MSKAPHTPRIPWGVHDEIPNDLPPDKEWVRLGDVVSWFAARTTNSLRRNRARLSTDYGVRTMRTLGGHTRYNLRDLQRVARMLSKPEVG